jgi:hypothetical protein
MLEGFLLNDGMSTLGAWENSAEWIGGTKTETKSEFARSQVVINFSGAVHGDLGSFSRRQGSLLLIRSGTGYLMTHTVIAVAGSIRYSDL